MSWKKAFLISIIITIVVFTVGYLLSAAFFIIILFIATALLVTVIFKIYIEWNKEFIKYYYLGLHENEKLQGILEARSEEDAIKIARSHNIIILEIHEATEEEISELLKEDP
jgi:hypothetical protein